MSADLISRFERYRASASLDRIRMSQVPADLKPLVKAYRVALSSQLTDPENQSWEILGPNEHYNALQVVRMAYGPITERPTGNCPRCAGSGIISAYSHVLGGRCLQCDGTGNINEQGHGQSTLQRSH
jgi:hypothetical protein